MFEIESKEPDQIVINTKTRSIKFDLAIDNRCGS